MKVGIVTVPTTVYSYYTQKKYAVFEKALTTTNETANILYLLPIRQHETMRGA